MKRKINSGTNLNDFIDMYLPQYLSKYKNGKSPIHIKPSKRGTFKAQAKKMGMGTQQAASKILNAPKGKYSPAMRKKANFAKVTAKWKK